MEACCLGIVKHSESSPRTYVHAQTVAACNICMCRIYWLMFFLVRILHGFLLIAIGSTSLSSYYMPLLSTAPHGTAAPDIALFGTTSHGAAQWHGTIWQTLAHSYMLLNFRNLFFIQVEHTWNDWYSWVFLLWILEQVFVRLFTFA